MKVFRGPSSKPFWDESHELVSRVNPSELEEGIRSKALMRFNITKEGFERQAVCTAQFEDADVIPMISGLLSRLQFQQKSLIDIKKVMRDKSLSSDEKIDEINNIIKEIK